MNLFGKKNIKNDVTSTNLGDVGEVNRGGVHKAYIPDFLYKPPFGYPRKQNVLLFREFAKNPYVYSVIKTLCDEVASTDYDIKPKKDVIMTPKLEELRHKILNFFDNPNSNKESFPSILRAVVKDIYEVDSGVIIKVYNKIGEFVEIYSRDGASFLKNPDIYGYLGNRQAVIEPMDIPNSSPTSNDWQASVNQYSMRYKEIAAYFQYGITSMALPVPFGRDEIIYIMQNPQSNSVYGLSPMQILNNTIKTLINGASYNNDFYENGNMPEGIISLLGGSKDTVRAFSERMRNQIKETNPITGLMRKIGFKIPVVNMETKFTSFQLDPQVMQIIEQQEWFTKLVWASFGVTAEQLGFTENSNKSTGQNQSSVFKRKAVRPLLKMLKYHIDKELIPEFGQEAYDNLCFEWDDYDLDEDKKKHDLLEQQIRMGVKSPEMVAEELQIDVSKLREHNEEKEERELNKYDREQQSNNFYSQKPVEKEDKKKEAVGKKSFESKVEKEFNKAIKLRTKEMIKALDAYKKGSIENIQ